MTIEKDYLAYANTDYGSGVWGRASTVLDAVEYATQSLVATFETYGAKFGIPATFEVADVTGYDEISFGGGKHIRSGKHKFKDTIFITVQVPKITRKGSHRGPTYKYKLLKSVAKGVIA